MPMRIDENLIAAMPMRFNGQADAGRGLETLTFRSDIFCGASALFWDGWDGLLAWVKFPGNARLRDRIVEIDNVKFGGDGVTV